MLINFQSNLVEICSLLVFITYEVYFVTQKKWKSVGSAEEFVCLFYGDMRKFAIYWLIDKKADEKFQKLFELFFFLLSQN